MINTNAAAINDHAPANAGHVKWFATNAYDEFQANLPNGAGTNVANLIAGFTSTSNYLGVNSGQLKNTLKPFYDRLVEECYTNSCPWTETTADDVSHAMVNIGQLKNGFDFDLERDTDNDAWRDWIERKLGTDWASSNSHPSSVSGLISYSGNQTGEIWVVAVTSPASWDLAYHAALSGLGGYSISNIPNLVSYWIKAYRDSNGSGTLDDSEAAGGGSDNPVYLTDDLTNVDVELMDPNTISGVLGYSGGQTGLIWVVATTSPASWEMTYHVVLSGPGNYCISNVPSLVNYWLKAYRDSDGDASLGYPEAWGESANSVYLTNDVANADITLTDPDADADGLSDWWEYLFFGDLSHLGSADEDGDGLSNTQEQQAGTDPTKTNVDDGGNQTGLEIYLPLE